MKAELKLNVENLSNDTEDYDAFREAIVKLKYASDQQFEDIKKEKWFNRVFDKITFSKKNEIRVAEQISSLAQAQQIFVELIFRLAENDTSISEIVLDNAEDIRVLSNQTVYLLERIKKLENSFFGIHADTDIRDLSQQAKDVLCALLYNVGQRKPSTESQANFANAVFAYIDIDDVQMDNPFHALEEFDEDLQTKRKILACCMEYMFLGACSDEAYDEYEDFIDEFDFGNKTVNSIKDQIRSIYNFRGVKGFYAKYEVQDIPPLPEIFYTEFGNEKFNEESFAEALNESEWYPVIETIHYNQEATFGTISVTKHEVYLALKADPEVRKSITKEAISVKSYGNYVYYLTEKDNLYVHLHRYDLVNKKEVVFDDQPRYDLNKDQLSLYNQFRIPRIPTYGYGILDCTNDWVVYTSTSKIVVVNLNNGKVSDIGYGRCNELQKTGGVILGDYFYMPLTTHHTKTIVISRFRSKEEKVERHFLYKMNLNTMEVVRNEFIKTPNIYEWVRIFSENERYLLGFWHDGNVYHYIKFDCEKNTLVDSCKIDYKAISFDYDSIFYNGKVYCLGQGFCFEKIELGCFDISTHAINIIDIIDIPEHLKPWDCKGNFYIENDKIRYEINIPSDTSLHRGFHDKRYIN